MQTGLDEKLKFEGATNIIILFLTVWSLHLKKTIGQVIIVELRVFNSVEAAKGLLNKSLRVETRKGHKVFSGWPTAF